MFVPDGDLLDTSKQRTFLGEATVQGRCNAFRPFTLPRSSLSGAGGPARGAVGEGAGISEAFRYTPLIEGSPEAPHPTGGSFLLCMQRGAGVSIGVSGPFAMVIPDQVSPIYHSHHRNFPGMAVS